MPSQQEILRALRMWRDGRAKSEGVDAWRVLSNQTLSDVVILVPKTKEELCAIKGIKEKKYQKYGREIFEILKNTALPQSPLQASPQHTSSISPEFSQANPQQNHRLSPGFSTRFSSPPSFSHTTGPLPLSVGAYLETLNAGLMPYSGKVQGEISSLDIRGKYLFFGLKDKEDGSTLNGFMWMNAYKMSGVDLKEGLEIVADGVPEIYKPSGRLSFRTETIELVGEGALKMAYDKLKAKLEKEGLFSPERKKSIPDYPETIGVITSKTGAVIHDFLNNIGRFGFRIRFLDSRVEGALSVRELVASVREFKKQKEKNKKGGIDALVIIRGGGSLESLQAFNNEMLVREIASCPFPVIAGIGHDKDIPLAALAADKMCSTPTAAAKFLNASWEQAFSRTRLVEQRIFSRFETLLREKIFAAGRHAGDLAASLQKMIERITARTSKLFRHVAVLGEQIAAARAALPKTDGRIASGFASLLSRANEKISSLEKILSLHNPEHRLRLGWSIAFSDAKVIRRVSDVLAGEKISVRVSDGSILAVVKQEK